MSESFISYHHGDHEVINLPRDSYVHFSDGDTDVTISIDDARNIRINTSSRVALEPVDVREFILHTIPAERGTIEPNLVSQHGARSAIWELRSKMVPGDVDPEFGIKGVDWTMD